MGRKRYTEDFKVEAVRHVTEAGHGVYDVASRLGISNISLYDWITAYGPESGAIQATRADQEELRKLKAELKRVTQERDMSGWKAAVIMATGTLR